MQHDGRMRCGQAMTCHKAQGMTLDYLNVSLQVLRSVRVGCSEVLMVLFCGFPICLSPMACCYTSAARVAPFVSHQHGFNRKASLRRISVLQDDYLPPIHLFCMLELRIC